MLAMGSARERERDRELLIPVAETLEDGGGGGSKSSLPTVSATPSHHTGREVVPSNLHFFPFFPFPLSSNPSFLFLDLFFLSSFGLDLNLMVEFSSEASSFQLPFFFFFYLIERGSDLTRNG